MMRRFTLMSIIRVMMRNRVEGLSPELQVKLNGLAVIENSRNPLCELLAGLFMTWKNMWSFISVKITKVIKHIRKVLQITSLHLIAAASPIVQLRVERINCCSIHQENFYWCH
ncbi:hypothetical protein ILYODFUR_018831 [Ilyodon furcidens]|uniref:Uncharacterized protein n=1 Tax=Ilyodon furcidens TaxID=33524 RepID=A0ABV0TBN7_9TELE